jgi:mono/diheme cytochrome c family protein
MKKYFALLLPTVFLLALMAFKTGPVNDPWPVPDKNKNMANPVKSDAASIAEGKAIYGQHCQSCHGKKGKGDGPKAAQLDTESGDFSTAEFQKQTDGALFYKTSEGRKDMPSYKKKISDQEDIWKVVNYLRTLK